MKLLWCDWVWNFERIMIVRFFSVINKIWWRYVYLEWSNHMENKLTPTAGLTNQISLWPVHESGSDLV